MESLKEAVLALDPGAVAMARRAGAGAAATLKELVGHREALVRELALQGLLELGGGSAVEACLGLALDDHPQVREAAVRGLGAMMDPAKAPALLEFYDKCPDPATRRHLALAYGKMDRAPAAPLRERMPKEREAEALEGLVVAAARLGDAEAQKEFLKGLQEAEGPDARGRFLGYAGYSAQPWVLKPLLPFLDDRSLLLRAGADGRSEVPEHLRTCDVATNVFLSISKGRFSFKPDPAIRYGDPEIDEVRRFLKGLP